MSIKITVGFPEDRWEDAKKIRIEALKDVPQAFLDDLESAEAEPKSFWVERAKSVVFAEVDGKVVGTVGFYQEEKAKQKHIANVVGVYVLPEYRGMKIGYQLLTKVLDEIKKNREIKVINLGVVDTQKKAMELYKSLGFVEVGKLKYAVNINGKYFDEYLMQLYL
jgi:ribosomal protein S18 acetylase RimI-like enzyme